MFLRKTRILQFGKYDDFIFLILRSINMYAKESCLSIYPKEYLYLTVINLLIIITCY